MISVNLIPRARLDTMALRRRLKRWTLAATTAVILFMIPVSLDAMHRAEASRLEAHLHEIRAQLTRTRAQVDAATIQADNARLRLERATALRTKRNWSNMVALIAVCLPESSWLTSLRTDPVSPVGVTVPRVAKRTSANQRGEMPQGAEIEAPRALRLVGYAAAAGEPHTFVANLKGSDVFERVELERLIREPVWDGSYFRFELRCEW